MAPGPFAEFPLPVRRAGVAVVLLLIVGLLAIAFQPGEEEPGTTQPVAADTTSSTAPAPAEAVATQPPAEAPPTAPPAARRPPAPPPKAAAPVPAPQATTSGDATIDATARSLVVSGTVRKLGNVDLRGVGDWSTSGQVTDANGRPLGRGSLRSDSPDVRATGTDISLGVTFLRIRADGSGLISSDLMHDSRPAVGHSFTVHGGTAVIEAAGMTFSSYEQEHAEPVPVASPVTVAADYGSLQVDYYGDDITWADVPGGPFPVAVAWLNWAGSGSITHGGHTYAHEYLGTRGGGDVTVDRSSGQLRLIGSVEVDQIWEDGYARIVTTAGVTVKANPGTIAAGSNGWFTWAPTNAGNFDMTMTRIGPANDHGGWVELRLDPLPDMDGGEDRPRRGADTSGLITYSSTKGISSMIRPGKGDERDIKIHVPEGTPPGSYTVSLIVEGNFDPIRVDVPVTVEPPSA